MNKVREILKELSGQQELFNSFYQTTPFINSTCFGKKMRRQRFQNIFIENSCLYRFYFYWLTNCTGTSCEVWMSIILINLL